MAFGTGHGIYGGRSGRRPRHIGYGGLGDDYYEGLLGAMPGYTKYGREMMSQIEGGYAPPPGTFAEAEVPAIEALKTQLAGGISPQRVAEMRRKVTGGFAAQAGRYAQAGAQRGYFSPGDVQTAVSGAPSAGLARGLGTMQVGIERERGRQRETGLRAAAEFREEMARPRRGYGAFVGRRMRGYGLGYRPRLGSYR